MTDTGELDAKRPGRSRHQGALALAVAFDAG